VEDSQSELRATCPARAAVLLFVVARTRRIPAVFSCRGPENDIDLIDAGTHLAFGSLCEQSRSGHRSLLHREYIPTGHTT
jgi:hypothetical protein